MVDPMFPKIESTAEIIAKVRADESERCALLAEELAARWERSAAKLRKDGSYWGGWFWRVKRVKPNWERAAREIDAASHGLRTVARGCREGWDPRKVQPPPLPPEALCGTCHEPGCDQ